MVFFFLLNPGDIVLLSTKIEVHLLMQGSTSQNFIRIIFVLCSKEYYMAGLATLSHANSMAET
jgi:hypothetical protein